MKTKYVLLSLIICLILSSCVSTENTKKEKQDTEKLPPLTAVEKQILEKLGGKVLPNNNLQIGKITINRKKNELSFPAKMCITDGGEYGIEVLISLPHGRTHEALMTTEIDPVSLQMCLYLIGAKNGSRIAFIMPGQASQGSLLGIDVEPKNAERVPVEDWLYHIETEEMPEKAKWVFVGSSFYKGKCMAEIEGNIVNVLPRGSTIIANASEAGDEQARGLGVSELDVPEPESPVTVYIYLAKDKEE